MFQKLLFTDGESLPLAETKDDAFGNEHPRATIKEDGSDLCQS